MKIKGFLISIITLLVLVSFSLHAAVAVKDIEYLNGKDFIQLYFKIDKMIPIPDVFYPEKGNNTRIIMRMSDVDFKPGKNLFTFDSSVIDSIKINKKSKHTDVEIRLKEQVNYRVFTNPKGLYIEFPKVKNVLAKKNNAAGKNLQAALKQPPKTAANPAVLPQGKNKQKRKKIPKPAPAVPETLKLAKKSPPPPAKKPGRLPEAENSGVIHIKDIVLAHKGPERISFEVLMSGATDFNVIPIPDEPARLAIDFKDARARRINKRIDSLNVKKIRGAYNSTSVYRLVFDLDYLKNYKVTPRGNVVEITFSNKTFPKKKRNIRAHKKPFAQEPKRKVARKAPLFKNKKTNNKKVAKNNTPRKTSPPAKIKISSPNDADIPIVETNAVTNAVTKPAPKKIAANKKAKPAAPKPVTPKTIEVTEPPITVKSHDVKAAPASNDFFGDEKSEVLLQSPESESGEKGEVEGDKKTIFSTQTIEGGTVIYTGRKMSFNFHDADLKDVIKIIAKISKLNIILDPGVSGRITSQLKDVPWDQALELFLRINGLAKVKEGNIIRIGRIVTLAREAAERAALKTIQKREGEVQIVTRRLSFAKVKEIKTILQKQLSNRGEILEDARSNTLIISDIPSRIPIIDKLISALDTSVPQVSIEARIVETRANYVESFGIQWGYNFVADPAHGNQTTLKFPHSISQGYAVNLPSTGGSNLGTLFSLGNVANTFNLDLALSAMQTSGNGRIISAPKTTTQNNMEAVIQQGKQIPVQVEQNNTITVQYKIAALELKVTPQITSRGTVICTLEINNNAADFANLVLGIPPITTQSIKTTVAVDDGGTIVIGGMYRIEKTTSSDGVPVLSKIPLLGALFKNKSKRNEQIELLVFITPRILK